MATPAKQRKSKGISTSPSKPRRKLLQSAAAKKRRLDYAKRMRDPKYAAKIKKYRKAYYKKNRAKLLKKAKATYKTRRKEILARRKRLRAQKKKTAGAAAKKAAAKKK